ncbi:Type 1 glutamine amidotransferase-like domain-containing protein [Mesobacillus boroniphilus]|uniref:Type 1 glutamine amidotransferase-like domain-containing protein n=1 Tax=Mesobacillus boroniphilus TaxID=308892 RepID=UPI001E65AE28|nr:Type 1 glutamine amidotransferase-like domain-containing protein [Mesobacillus boroniphilus]
MKTLGFLKGSNCPHNDGEKERRPAYHRFVGSGRISWGYAADDGAALHYIDEELVKAVSSRPEAEVYNVYQADGKEK